MIPASGWDDALSARQAIEGHQMLMKVLASAQTELEEKVRAGVVRLRKDLRCFNVVWVSIIRVSSLDPRAGKVFTSAGELLLAVLGGTFVLVQSSAHVGWLSW